MTAFVEMTGREFGRLTVIQRAHNNSRGRAQWLCQCACGQLAVVEGSQLRDGRTESCGCLHREMVATGLRFSHGMARRDGMQPVYNTWRGIIRRCTNPQSSAWDYYGGRGITVCDRWRDFATFLADVGERPAPGLTLDRIDNDGNYEPGNVRWATWSEQARNSRNAKLSHVQVTEIVAHYVPGRGGNRVALAREYGITSGYVSQLVRNATR